MKSEKAGDVLLVSFGLRPPAHGVGGLARISGPWLQLTPYRAVFVVSNPRLGGA
jgi:hypothetical protein